MKKSKLIFIFYFFILLVVVILLTKVLLKPIHIDEIGKSVNDQRKELAGEMKGNWLMFHGEPNLVGSTSKVLSDSLTVFWKFKTGGEVKSSPAIDEGLVFIGSSDGNVYAIDLKNGNQVWAYKTGGAVEATACVVKDLVFIGSSDGFLYALDKRAGQLQWKYETEGEILGSANWLRSDDGEELLVIVGSYDSRLYCLNSAD